jgi:hypothetical protein
MVRTSLDRKVNPPAQVVGRIGLTTQKYVGSRFRGNDGGAGLP